MWKKIRELLSHTETATSGRNQPFLVERISRSKNFEADFALWEAGGGASDAFRKWREDEKEDIDDRFFRIVEQGSANGFVLYPYPHEEKEFDYILELLKNRVLEFGYVLRNAERRFFEQKETIRTVDRYYLKPRLSSDDFEGKRRQVYGNLLIELQKVDQKPMHLKFMSTIFSDRKYQDPLPFRELMERLLG